MEIKILHFILFHPNNKKFLMCGIIIPKTYHIPKKNKNGSSLKIHLKIIPINTNKKKKEGKYGDKRGKGKNNKKKKLKKNPC